MLNRRLTGDDWTLDQHLLAINADQLRIANWQRSKSGQKGTRKPKPISPLARKSGATYGKTTEDADAVKAKLAAYRAGQFDRG